MRLDKYLKVSRLIKRRTIANEVCSSGRVLINDRIAKPASRVEVGDVITLIFASGQTKVKVLKIQTSSRKDLAAEMYEILPE
ncbi:MAG: RNA-binding S4 domain-containing protein [Clostridiaceae bacterium]|mgnify:FL=1|nr:RNA-binding S4 domain-containing protein [Clostridiaceae bacterium]